MRHEIVAHEADLAPGLVGGRWQSLAIGEVVGAAKGVPGLGQGELEREIVGKGMAVQFVGGVCGKGVRNA